MYNYIVFFVSFIVTFCLTFVGLVIIFDIVKKGK